MRGNGRPTFPGLWRLARSVGACFGRCKHAFMRRLGVLGAALVWIAVSGASEAFAQGDLAATIRLPNAYLTMERLLTGGVGLASIVIVRLVKSRSELALKRALGATQVRVARISLAMALRIAAYAAVVGLLAGGAVNYWVTTLAPWDFAWPWREAVDSVAVALVVAVLAVILPVVSFSRAQPWAVLKEE